MVRYRDKRRKRAARKILKENTPQPQAWWAEAFMILLLHKAGGSLTVSMKSLENFEKLKSNNKTEMVFNPDDQTVTIMAPEIQVSELTLPNKKIITEIN